jgi:putative N6-adenine-specific DNA methylase
MTHNKSRPELFDCVAQTFLGLEDVLVAELKQLGAGSIKKLSRAVSFRASQETLYRVNLWLRTATRVLKSVHQFKARNEDELYNGMRALDWGRLMDVKQTLAVSCVVKSELLRHSQYAALKTKDAIVDQFRANCGERPSVDVANPDLRVHVYIHNDQCFVSLDSSGASLHRRGYRLEGNVAPLNEVSAAGLVQLTGWDRKTPLVDPMCGSGTIIIEAAMQAHTVAPGMYREDFGFMHWKDFNEALWEQLVDEALGKTAYTDTMLYGSDISAQAVQVARANVGRTTLGEKIRLLQSAFQDLPLPADKGIIIMNPPYDERLKVDDVAKLYKMIGDVLKQNFKGWTAWILSSSQAGLKNIGLNTYAQTRIYNGALECSFNKYGL